MKDEKKYNDRFITSIGIKEILHESWSVLDV